MSKPFDLERAMAGDPVQTECGYLVRIGLWDVEGDYPLVGVAFNHGWTPYMWMGDGTYDLNGPSSRPNLRMAPKKVKLWRRLYTHAFTDPRYGYHYFVTGGHSQERIIPPYEWVRGHDWEEFEVDE